MVQSCCICHKTPLAGTSLHKIPRVNLRMMREYVDIMKARRKAWIRVLERTLVLDFDNLERYFVCSKHFVSGKPSDFRNQNSVDWIPSIECEEPNEVINTPEIGPQSTDVLTGNDRTGMTTADNLKCALLNIPTDELRKEDEEDLREFFDVMSSFHNRKGEPEIEKATDQSFNELQITLFGVEDNATDEVTIPQDDDYEKEDAEMGALIKSLRAQVISQNERIESQNECIEAQNKRIGELEKTVERLSWTLGILCNDIPASGVL